MPMFFLFVANGDDPPQPGDRIVSRAGGRMVLMLVRAVVDRGGYYWVQCKPAEQSLADLPQTERDELLDWLVHVEAAL